MLLHILLFFTLSRTAILRRFNSESGMNFGVLLLALVIFLHWYSTGIAAAIKIVRVQ